MKRAFLRVVAGLARRAAMVGEVLSGAQVAMWMLLVRRTPLKSDLLDTPVRSRFSVVSLFPEASRNWKGVSCRSKGFSASSEMTCSISAAFSRHSRG
jgi:hypothetical protein